MKKLRIKKEIIGFFVIILICFIMFFSHYLNSNHYEGQFSGVVSDGDRSQAAVCDIARRFIILHDLHFIADYFSYC